MVTTILNENPSLLWLKSSKMKEKEVIQKRFGKHLRKLRLEKDMTGAELARRTFIDKPHIARLEAGRTNPTLTTLLKIASALDLPLEELFKGFKS